MTNTEPQRSPSISTRRSMASEARTQPMTLPRVVRISPQLLSFVDEGTTVGFVEKVGPVYVALAGDRYDRAVEVAQSRELERAAQSLLATLS